MHFSLPFCPFLSPPAVKMCITESGLVIQRSQRESDTRATRRASKNATKMRRKGEGETAAPATTGHAEMNWATAAEP